MKAVITVVGNDKVGILAQVCTSCAESNVNVEEVSQNILSGTFAMIMVVNVANCNTEFTAFADKMAKKGTEMGVDIRCTRQETFDAMHRI